MNHILIRPILPADNNTMATVIRQVLRTFKAPEKGTALADASLDSLYAYYQQARAVYFVIEKNQTIIGGAGIAPLENCNENICELQKMYFLPEARGLGLGHKMIHLCLQQAKKFLYKGCYLETMEYMLAAQKLYKKTGFLPLDKPLGDTGHYSCPVYMYKKFRDDL